MTLVMRRSLSLLGLLLLGAGVAGLVWWQEQTTTRADAGRTAGQKLFSFANASEIKAVELHVGDLTYALERSGEGETGWHLRSPLRTLADASTVDAMLQAAVDLQLSARVGGGGDRDDFQKDLGAPTDLKIFGLAEPRFRLLLDDAAGRREVLLVGSRNDFDDSLYVKRDDRSDVGLVPSGLEFQLDKDIYKLRDKRPFIFAEDEVQGLSISQGGSTTLALERQGTSWRLVQPLQADADADQVGQLLGALTGLRAQHFAAEVGASPGALQAFGLTAPAYVVSIKLTSGTTASLRFGSVPGDAKAPAPGTAPAAPRAFVMLAGDNPVLELGNDAVLKTLARPADALRDLRLLRADRDAVQQLQLQRGDAVLSFVREHDPKSGHDSWKQTAPEAATVDSSKVAALLYRLHDLKADSVVAETASPSQLETYGLKTPSLQISLLGAEGAALGQILVGRTEADKTFVTGQTSGRVDRVSRSSLDALSTVPGDYQATPPPEATPPLEAVPPPAAGVPGTSN